MPRLESLTRLSVAALAATAVMVGAAHPQSPSPSQSPALPATPLTYGFLAATFAPDGTFTITGSGWPKLAGKFVTANNEIELSLTSPMNGCADNGKYRYQVTGKQVTFVLVTDTCAPRRMMLADSTWLPAGEKPVIPARKIVRSSATGVRALPAAAPVKGSWPSFRGREASGVADGQALPDEWNVEKRQNILWTTAVPGLAHSSPVVWGDSVFLATAVSSKGNATFKPGLYGDGDASDDRSTQKWQLLAIDKKTGSIRWQKTAVEGVPIDKRHIKSTYASATPATDGQLVVASFGSMGVYAFDVAGNFRWKVDYGQAHLGAYDLPAFEWGPASSPIIWNNLVIVQVDTHTDSFLLAVNKNTGATVWKTEREELPSWGTPTVATTPAGPVLVTNASHFVRAYDPRTGKELWRIGKSSKITAPTPIFADGLVVVASGRAPERPIFVVKPDAHGDLTLPDGETSNAGIVWSKTGRGSYMPTPLAYRGLLYVLANNGVLDAYEFATGKEVYRQRLPVIGSGYSASPVAADGKIYLSSEDGDMLVVAAGPEFKVISTNPMSDMLMATPALSDGVMYVRSSRSLIAIGKK
ncbi:MAG TPA: PQQ-binding-like beta-propeller repeat protein [Vicinamibacterales bacterium]|nr:PQQ-binding-like beta-propeller repeat protein [Vicinamibacterales bacterium]